MSFSNDNFPAPPESGDAHPDSVCNIVPLRERENGSLRPRGISWLSAEKAVVGEGFIHASLALATIATVAFFFRTTCEFSENIDHIARRISPSPQILMGNSTETEDETTLTNASKSVGEPAATPGMDTNVAPAVAVPMGVVPMGG